RFKPQIRACADLWFEPGTVRRPSTQISAGA
ncbi:MAG: hypothetical protein ACJA0V_002895, partial [Planctomycetota bacterium]